MQNSTILNLLSKVEFLLTNCQLPVGEKNISNQLSPFRIAKLSCIHAANLTLCSKSKVC
ncbi:hypothetical protein SAMN03080598_02032 [Algoriphagus boritolerans DSM 17298 = JCM 18970]|uniref:Uncharacterized protein n=1 Tax=Algoriphagus boritolerans DSM 17298 = JCM 18970 TaxID=1120964 RepID=A0A1H5WCN7_9BACT|nr:hypothetical protein SAMN03080598_02032 [Algoriphagus boritolerans DSM 17298 = JCM 18970]